MITMSTLTRLLPPERRALVGDALVLTAAVSAALALGVAAARRILGVAGGVALDPTRFADLRPDPAEAS
ncbi:MAG: hypothetical protein KC464_33600 [Myxococcales bacterium]|nr:hypothetical protein [Myxococcales bacterium]